MSLGMRFGIFKAAGESGFDLARGVVRRPGRNSPSDKRQRALEVLPERHRSGHAEIVEKIGQEFAAIQE